MKYNRKVIVGMSDFQSGHKLGLLSPNTVLEDENENGEIIEWCPQLSEPQKYLWNDVYIPAINSISDLAEKDDIHVIYDGDITHGTRYPVSLVSMRIADQILIAEATFFPILKLKQTKTLHLVKGTGVHEFEEGTATILVDQLLRPKYPTKHIKSLYHGLLSVEDFVVDYSHHGAPPGSRDWLKGNEVRYYLRSIMYSEIKLGNKPADLYLRGHYHEPILEWLSMGIQDKEYESWMCILPSMCMLDEHSRKVTRSNFTITNGIYAFEIINNKIHEIHKFKKTLDIRTKEEI